MPENPSETGESDDASFDESGDTLRPPPKEEVKHAPATKEEMTWDEVVRIFRAKLCIWIKRRNGRWVIGEIMGIDERAKKLMVKWKELIPVGEKTKYVNFATFKKWWQESPALPPRRTEDDGDEDDYESR